VVTQAKCACGVARGMREMSSWYFTGVTQKPRKEAKTWASYTTQIIRGGPQVLLGWPKSNRANATAQLSQRRPRTTGRTTSHGPTMPPSAAGGAIVPPLQLPKPKLGHRVGTLKPGLHAATAAWRAPDGTTLPRALMDQLNLLTEAQRSAVLIYLNEIRTDKAGLANDALRQGGARDGAPWGWLPEPLQNLFGCAARADDAGTCSPGELSSALTDHASSAGHAPSDETQQQTKDSRTHGASMHATAALPAPPRTAGEAPASSAAEVLAAMKKASIPASAAPLPLDEQLAMGRYRGGGASQVPAVMPGAPSGSGLLRLAPTSESPSMSSSMPGMPGSIASTPQLVATHTSPSKASSLGTVTTFTSSPLQSQPRRIAGPPPLPERTPSASMPGMPGSITSTPQVVSSDQQRGAPRSASALGGQGPTAEPSGACKVMPGMPGSITSSPQLHDS
jgi:hypothetical protein